MNKLNSKNQDNKTLNYTVLANKYRPKLFSDLLSQAHVTRIIKNSISNNKIPHSYIFTGIRGVGKTTLARIVSRALNCIKNGSETPVFIPCLKCTNCVAIGESRHQDILEIDAASNTGVNDIRGIIENAKYKPITSRYKIYIIDEAHMLSNSAFNALLKIIEEPPEHVKFILATTEIMKIPLTVLSRCQRFDLHRVTTEQLTSFLKDITEKEGCTLEQNAARLIAKAAQGSVRDALSILDQAIISLESNGIITLKVITEMLGTVNLEYIYKIIHCILNGNINNALYTIRELYSKGAEPHLIIQELMEISYKITLCKIGNANKTILLDFELQKCNEIAQEISMISITRIWQMLSKALVDLKTSYDELITIEMSIIKIIHANFIVSPEEIMESLSNNHDCSTKNTTSLVPSNSSLDKIEDLFLLLEQKMEMMLLHTIKNSLAIIEFKKGYIKIQNDQNINKHDIRKKLSTITNFNWIIEIDNSKSGVIYAQKESKEKYKKEQKIIKSNLVQETLKSFSGIEINDIKLSSTNK